MSTMTVWCRNCRKMVEVKDVGSLCWKCPECDAFIDEEKRNGKDNSGKNS